MDKNYENSNIENFIPNTKIIHIDIDPAEIGKNVNVDLPIFFIFFCIKLNIRNDIF